MAIDAKRAEFWKKFILDNAAFPAPDILRFQFEASSYSGFCPCHCNSFELSVDKRRNVGSLFKRPRKTGETGSRVIYEVDFELTNDKFLSITLFANEQGFLTGVDVECCYNTYPVPDHIESVSGPNVVHIAADVVSE